MDTLTLDSSTPLHLDSGAWTISAGELDLFAVPTDADGNTGRRFYIGSVAAGSLVLGVPDVQLGPQTWRLYAVGVDAELDPVDDWAGHEGIRPWLIALTSELENPGQVVPLADAVVGEERDVTTGQVLRCLRHLSWVATEQGALTLAGQPAPGEVPVVDIPVFEVVRDVRIQVVTPTDPMNGVRWYGAAALVAHAARASDQISAEVAADADRVQLEELARQEAMSELSAIDDHARVQVFSDRDPVLGACQLLGELDGIAITAPPDWARSQTSDPVRAIARASGVRVRAVTLTPGWWRHGFDTMLAFRAEHGQPVVLTGRKRIGYDLVDPATGARERVTKALAATLRPTGYVFYEPLATESIGVGKLLRFGLTGGRKDLMRTLSMSMLAGVLSLAVPVATGRILGSLVPAGLTSLIVAAAALLFFVVFATTGVLLSRSAALLRLQGRMLSRMESGIWDRLMGLPVQFFGNYSVADLTLRVGGVESIQYIVSSVASTTLLSFVTLVFSLALLFVYDAGVALMVLIATLIVVTISSFVTVRQIKKLRAMYDAKGEASAVLVQLVQGMDKVRAAAAEGRALGAWSSKFARQAHMLLDSERLSAIRTAMYAALPVVLTLILFAAVGTNPGVMSTASFLAFITALGQITSATTQLDLSLGYVLNIVPLFDRMRPILNEETEDRSGASDPGRLSGRVSVNNVTYRYPGMSTPVLQDLNLTVEPGEFLAIVGPSGSGKSTVVRLLLGFDHPEGGSITYDGKDLMTLDHRAVRSQIGVALQNSSVTGGDIFKAIVGDWPLTEDDAWTAAEKVGLADDIRALPMGMRTLLGDNAATFSGGQRQRLVLAGAIARDPRIVVLDEATSALDSVTQAHVMRSFENLQVTRIVIAHRLSTIRNARHIVVLDGGRIVQEGSYDELAGVPGLFQNMVRRQTL
jgi:NHLM bacteriocin system ABC transporter ATP-binding protein